MNNSSIILSYMMICCSGYIIGSVPWAFILGKINGIDIRKHGSCNVGATNVRRVLGKKWGIICFFLDFLKGFLPVIAVTLLIRQNIIDDVTYGVVAIALSSVAGHIWPLFLKFRGGKGISTIAGILLAVAPLALLVSGLIWWIVFSISRYVSLASIIAAFFLPIAAFLFSHYSVGNSVPLPELIMLLFLAILAIFKHRGNIKRLINGTENRFTRKCDEAEQNADTNPDKMP